MCDSSRRANGLGDAIRPETHLSSQRGGAAASSVSKHSSEDGMDCASSPTVKARCQLLPSLERIGARPLPAASNASTRRSRLQKQQEIRDGGNNVSQTLSVDTGDKGSLTPSMRKKYLQELFLNNGLGSGFGSLLVSSKTSHASSGSYEDNDSAFGEGIGYSSYWALDPMEHAWILSVVDGNYETILPYITSDLSLLTRKDFVSGYTALHWLAKYGKHETLIKLLKHAEKEDYAVDVNMKGSGGLTPLHVAAMHSQFMVVKILVGAFGAKTDVMDYNGKKPWQYLKHDAPDVMKELLGAWDDDPEGVGLQNVNNNSSGAVVPNEDIVDQETKQTTVRRNDSWRKSFKKLFTPILSFVSKD